MAGRFSRTIVRCRVSSANVCAATVAPAVVEAVETVSSGGGTGGGGTGN